MTEIIYNGIKVYVNKIKGKGTIIGEPYTSPRCVQYPRDFKDNQINETMLLKVNGGIFYSYDDMYYANGIEISQGNINQAWDTEYDNVYGLGIKDDFTPIFAKQRDLKNMKLRSAVTANFGIVINGVKLTSLSYVTNYYPLSGRTIIGHNGSEWVIISFGGVTGKTGMSGNQLGDLCLQQGCVNALCMDGGGSVYLNVGGNTIINTTRKIKNAFMIYGESENDMPLKLVVRKQVLYLRKELRFVYKYWDDLCPFTKTEHTTKRYVADGALVRDENGKAIKLDIGDSVEIVEFIPKLQLDGWQWLKVKYNDQICYAQYDSMAYSIEKM